MRPWNPRVRARNAHSRDSTRSTGCSRVTGSAHAEGSAVVGAVALRGAVLACVLVLALAECGAACDEVVRCVHGSYDCRLERCVCLDGWRGTNCSLCVPLNTTHTHLAPPPPPSLIVGPPPPHVVGPCGSNMTCNTGVAPATGYKKQLQCEVTDETTRGWLGGGAVDLACNFLTATNISTNETDPLNTCQLNVWRTATGPPAAFACWMDSCGFHFDSTSQKSIITCESTHCECQETPKCAVLLESVLSQLTGSTELVCDPHDNSCVLNQHALPTAIDVSCISGDCYPVDFELPSKPYWTTKRVLTVALSSAAVLVLLLTGAFLGWRRRRLKQYQRLLDSVSWSETDAVQDAVDRMTYHLAFRDVSLRVGESVILSDIRGFCGPGTVTAIMGPSGAGKTSLLNLLAGRHSSGVVNGDISVNGQPRRSARFRRISGYVRQDDFLLPTLTVRETLMYYAELRLPQRMSTAEKVGRVTRVMADLGLVEIADSRVGDKHIRGISGGERRRVSIACELVTAPRILFLDEPTSGLDSCTAFAIIECVCELARRQNLAVILSIHQPRSSIFQAFDQLILLSRGQMIFNGRASHATSHFAQLGYACPPEFNPADYLLDVITTSPEGTINALVHDYATSPSEQTLRRTLEAAFGGLPLPGLTRPAAASTGAIPPLAHGRVGINAAPAAQSTGVLGMRSPAQGQLIPIDSSGSSGEGDTRRRAAVRGPDDHVGNTDIWSAETGSWSGGQGSSGEDGSDGGELFMRPLLVPGGVVRPGRRAPSPMVGMSVDTDGTREPIKAYATSFLHQLWQLCQRTTTNVVRNPSLGLAHMAVSVLVALLLGWIYWQVGHDWPGLQNRSGSIFFILALLSFSTLSSIEVFIAERGLFEHERSNGCYRTSAYFLAKAICDLIPLRIVPPLVMGAIAYPMIGLRKDLVAFLWFELIIVLVNVTATGICMMIGACVPNVGVGNLVSTLAMLFFMLFGGFLINKDTVTGVFVWFKDLSFFNYAYEALMVNELLGTTIDFEVTPGNAVPLKGVAVLDKLSLDPANFDHDVTVLFLMSVSFLFAAYVLIRLRILLSGVTWSSLKRLVSSRL